MKPHFLKDIKNNLINNSKEIDYVSDYRPSNLPFCSIDQYVTLLRKNISFKILPALQKITLANDLYTSMGTEIHTITQQYLARQGILLGDYHCKNCDCTVIQTINHICPFCNTEMNYEELGFELSDNYIGGHTDGILVLNKLWLMDIKTTTTYNLKKDLPYEYLLQGSIYWNKLLEQRGIKCDGICFLMIPRNNVNAMEFRTFTNINAIKLMYRGITKQYNNLMEDFKNKTFNHIKRLYTCKEDCLSKYTPCPYTDWCWKDDYIETLKGLRNGI